MPRALTTFFRQLTNAVGREVPADAMAPLLAPSLRALDSAAPVSPELRGELLGLGRRLGLLFDELPRRVDQAARLAQDGRVVLLIVERAHGHELVLVRTGEGPLLEAACLRGGRVEARRPTVAGFAEALDIDAEALFAAFQVRSMGGGVASSDGAHSLHQGRPLRRLWSILRDDRSAICLVVGLAAAVGILGLAIPVAVQALVNFVSFGSLLQPVFVLGALVLGFLSLSGAVRVFKSYVVEILQRRVFVRVVSDMALRLPRVRLDAYDRGYGPELINRFFDVVIVQKAVATLLIDGLDMVLQAGIGLLLLGFYHPFLLLFDVLLIAMILLIVLGIGRGAVTTAIKESKVKYEVAGALEDLARAPLTYKLFGAPELARARLVDLAGSYVGARSKHYRLVLWQQIGAVALYAGASTALLTLGGLLVIEGQLTLGQLIAAELIVSVALSSFVKFGKQLEVSYDMLAGVDKLGALYDLPLEDSAGEPHVAAAAGARVELRAVSYAYPGCSPVVTDLSMRIEAGAQVAVLAPRAAAKSTVAELMCGLRRPDSGLVLFDGLDLRGIAPASLHAQIKLAKGFEVVPGDIVDNVRLGRSDVTIDDVHRVLRRFGILDDLMALPDGLRTQIAVTGAPLSTNTVRMLMLARSVVGGARVVVIDSLLDELAPDLAESSLAALRESLPDTTLVVLTARPEVARQLPTVLTLTPSTVAATGGGV
ncbi:MAG: ATP-binding cassette domain-containing protein [Planctomycetota bacterium]